MAKINHGFKGVRNDALSALLNTDLDEMYESSVGSSEFSHYCREHVHKKIVIIYARITVSP